LGGLPSVVVVLAIVVLALVACWQASRRSFQMSRATRNHKAAEYELARLSRDLTTAITWYMDEHNWSQRRLADKLGVTPGRVSQILSGDENLTVRTLAAVCAALDAHMEATLIPNRGQLLDRDYGHPQTADFPEARPAPLVPAPVRAPVPARAPTIAAGKVKVMRTAARRRPSFSLMPPLASG